MLRFFGLIAITAIMSILAVLITVYIFAELAIDSTKNCKKKRQPIIDL